jgi:hypothetical protein
MIDPITIGLAFTAAQETVGYIKKAISLGKDVNSLYGSFAKFFENSDKIHIEHNRIKAGISELTDGQIRSLSLQIAMQSKALRDVERELKDMLVWSGNKEVWDEMQRERIRMTKERTDRERELKRARAQANADIADRFFIFITFVAIAIPTFGFVFAMLKK